MADRQSLSYNNIAGTEIYSSCTNLQMVFSLLNAGSQYQDGGTGGLESIFLEDPYNITSKTYALICVVK